MKYIVKAENSKWGEPDFEVENFLEWLRETKDQFFMEETPSEYLSYIDEETLESYVDHKRGYEIRRIIVQENGTENYYGLTLTFYNFGEYEYEGWSGRA